MPAAPARPFVRRLGLGPGPRAPRAFTASALVALLPLLGVTTTLSAHAQTGPAPAAPSGPPAPSATPPPAASPPSAPPPIAPEPVAPVAPEPVAAPAPAPVAPESVAAPAPTPVAAPAPTPVAAPAPTPVAAPAPAPLTPRLVLSPGEAFVHVAVSHRDAWLETRSFVDGGDFARTCAAPCDIKLRVEGLEARVVAPGMTTSNVFRIDAGSGVAGVRVDGGSARARRAGVITLAAGIPVALAGMAMFALGRVHDKPGLEAGGIAGLAVGGLSVSVSLPLLLIGTTTVKNAKGSLIALGPAPTRSF